MQPFSSSGIQKKLSFAIKARLARSKKVTALEVKRFMAIKGSLSYIRIWVRFRMAPVAFLLTRRSIDRISLNNGLTALQDTMECLLASLKIKNKSKSILHRKMRLKDLHLNVTQLHKLKKLSMLSMKWRKKNYFISFHQTSCTCIWKSFHFKLPSCTYIMISIDQENTKSFWKPEKG